jgi:hypothetical protein
MGELSPPVGPRPYREQTALQVQRKVLLVLRRRTQHTPHPTRGPGRYVPGGRHARSPRIVPAAQAL